MEMGRNGNIDAGKNRNANEVLDWNGLEWKWEENKMS